MATTKKPTEEKKVVKKSAPNATKAAVKPVAKTTVKKEAAESKTVKTAAVKETKTAAPVKTAKASTGDKVNLSVDVFDLTGKVTGKLSLPVEIFGEKVNRDLLHQAIRVYQANKRQGNASTKTRGEVDGSTRKIYRQKGTGRARHGSLRAPIFVKGGIVHGPKPRDFSLDLPKKMRRKALFSALSSKLIDGQVMFIAGIDESMEPKTKGFVAALKALGFAEPKNMLLVMSSDLKNVKYATGNVQGVMTTVAGRLNALDVLKSRQILFSRDAVTEMKKLLPKE
jgi:large subunit ribosomal protein L4